MALKMPTHDEMRVEFHSLRGQLDKAFAEIKPKQDAYEAKRLELMEREQKELKPLENELQAAREGLGIYAIQKQMGMISRALGGETALPSEPSEGAAS